jgi:8-oxo-dGTP diphosphatase
MTLDTVTITVVAAVIEDHNGCFLMQLRDDIPTISHPGHWSIFGGRLEAGETISQAICREIKEELALTTEAHDYRPIETFSAQYVRSGVQVHVTYHVLYINVAERGDHAVLGEGQAMARMRRAQLTAACQAGTIDSRPITPWVCRILSAFLAA